ncbi:MAG TPA: thioesterase family protein [Anaerolineae bacterium]|nr:thioesterase family protein [Anaerolineae bacterium]
MTVETFHCSTPITIRFRDLDAFGHVNNAVYFTFMEMARVAYFTQIGLLKPSEFPSPFFIIAEATCQYKAPIDLQTSLIIQVRVSRLGNSSFDMAYRFVDEVSGIVLATGRTVQVTYDYAANRSVPLPDEWRTALARLEGL